MEFSEYIDINKVEIPYSFEADLGGEVYEIEINYNKANDFFTVDLFKDGVALVVGEKLILNRPLFRNRISNDLPSIEIIPLDRSNSSKRITYSNFSDTVFLYVGGEVLE